MTVSRDDYHANNDVDTEDDDSSEIFRNVMMMIQ